MARKTKEEAEKTRSRILASALALFVRKGYEHTTFTDIAERLKLTKGAVYWHFASKETLLVALVNEMLKKFMRQLDESMPTEGLTYPAVTRAMVTNAARIVESPRRTAFFMLLKTQVKWGGDSMQKVREQLMSDGTRGPYHAFLEAIEADIAAGRVRADVSPVGVASVSMAIWDGMVRARIEHFLQCDLCETLSRAFDGIWTSIKEKVK